MRSEGLGWPRVKEKVRVKGRVKVRVRRSEGRRVRGSEDLKDRDFRVIR